MHLRSVRLSFGVCVASVKLSISSSVLWFYPINHLLHVDTRAASSCFPKGASMDDRSYRPGHVVSSSVGVDSRRSKGTPGFSDRALLRTEIREMENLSPTIRISSTRYVSDRIKTEGATMYLGEGMYIVIRCSKELFNRVRSLTHAFVQPNFA